MINKAVILYEREDLAKNQKFVQILTDCFHEHHMDVKVMVDREDDFSRIGRNYLVVNRSRNAVLAAELEKRGATVVNSSEVTAICNNKWTTYEWARNNGIPVMETWLGGCYDCEFPIVIKSLSGHGGSEVFLAHNSREKQKFIQIIESIWGKNKYIIQPLANTGGRDVRVYVLGGRIAVAMCRQADGGFKSNYSLGGNAIPVTLNSKEQDMIMNTVNLLKPDYAGIDFFYDGERLVLNEIEDAVGARMVYENTELDIVKMFGDWMVKHKIIC